MNVDILTYGFVDCISQPCFMRPTILSWNAVYERMNERICRLRPRQRDIEPPIIIILFSLNDFGQNGASISSVQQIGQIFRDAPLVPKLITFRRCPDESSLKTILSP